MRGAWLKRYRIGAFIPFMIVAFIIGTPLFAKAQPKAGAEAKGAVEKKSKQKSIDDSKSEKPKPTKALVPIARVREEQRSGKVFELVGGGAFMDGYPGLTGHAGLLIGPDLIMEAGLFYGMQASKSSYLDGWVQGKFFVSDLFFLALGGGVGKISTTHDESLTPEAETWKESATKLRLYAGLGPQFSFLVFTVGMQVGVGFAKIMGKVENDLPDDNKAAQEKAESTTTIASGLNYNVSAFLGFAF